MDRILNPRAVGRAVWRSVNAVVLRTVEGAVSVDVNNTVWWASYLDVDRAVVWAVRRAMEGAVRRQPLHPNIDRFLTGLRQTRGSTT